MIEAAIFIESLRKLGYSHYAGVPCSFLKPFINYVIDDASLDYIGTTSEGEAVGISMGAFLAGQKTVTLCQNSGLGNMVNPLTSLSYPFRIPTLLISTWRGEPGIKDEPQHEQMGRIMPGLFDALEIPWKPFPTKIDQIAPTLAEAEASMLERQRPFGLIMSKESVSPHALTHTTQSDIVQTEIQSHRAKGAKGSESQGVRSLIFHRTRVNYIDVKTPTHRIFWRAVSRDVKRKWTGSHLSGRRRSRLIHGRFG